MTPKHFTEVKHYHYLTFSCLKHTPLFLDETLYVLFLNSLRKARSRGLFKLSAFVLMPNHVHLLILPEGNNSISSILIAVKQPFSHRALTYMQAQYPEVYSELIISKGDNKKRVFWQPGGGYNRNIFTKAVYDYTLDYIHLNPVRKAFVEAPQDWKWSSASFYQTGKSDTVEIDLAELW